MPGALLAVAYASLLLFAMRRMPFYARVPGLSMRGVAALFLLKVAAGTALWAVYTYVYTDRATADVFKYFDDSAVLFSALPERPGDYLRMLFSVDNDTPWFDEQYYQRMNNWYRQWESNLHNDAHTVIRFNAVVRLFSFGHFHVHTVAAAFLSLTGTLGLYRAFVGRLAGRERALAIALFGLPSVLFWASGVIKESLLFFGLGILVWQVLRMLDGRATVAGALMLGAAMALLYHLKFYVLLSMVPALAFLAWARLTGGRRPLLKMAVVYAAFIAAGLNAQRFIPGFDILEVITWKQRDFIGLALETRSGSFVMPPLLQPDALSFVRTIPYALWITLAGPVAHGGGGALGLASAAENIVVLAVLAALLQYRLPWSGIDRPLLLALAGYGFVLACVIGWTTPIMGALVRYRAPLLPFLLVAALLAFDHRRALARWPRLKPLLSA
ncbi:MAG: hypothetical protein QY325_09790 [Flavobacteriales bacterium]|jgi:hypothetical protein|nr:MAG: hypothetical protein QY325_09790 [Flavobacteriales bacterium]